MKALTPNMEGDAIGGAMNMIMKSAPDHLVISAKASTGFSTLFSERFGCRQNAKTTTRLEAELSMAGGVWQKFTDKFISTVHSLTVADIDGNTVVIRQLDAAGNELDSFKITKD
jgi:hypothetical protein